MKSLCVISARGGSRGLPDKNIRLLLDKPLIAWSIEQALATPGIDRVVVSTDSKEIAAVARAAGAETPFLRPDYLVVRNNRISAKRIVEDIERRSYMHQMNISGQNAIVQRVLMPVKNEKIMKFPCVRLRAVVLF